jgi:hypothetical protein
MMLPFSFRPQRIQIAQLYIVGFLGRFLLIVASMCPLIPSSSALAKLNIAARASGLLSQKFIFVIVRFTLTCARQKTSWSGQDVRKVGRFCSRMIATHGGTPSTSRRRKRSIVGPCSLRAPFGSKPSLQEINVVREAAVKPSQFWKLSQYAVSVTSYQHLPSNVGSYLAPRLRMDYQRSLFGECSSKQEVLLLVRSTQWHFSGVPRSRSPRVKSSNGDGPIC